MTPEQYTAAHAAIRDIILALGYGYAKEEITDEDADELLRMLNAPALFLSLKPITTTTTTKGST